MIASRISGQNNNGNRNELFLKLWCMQVVAITRLITEMVRCPTFELARLHLQCQQLSNFTLTALSITRYTSR